MSACRTLTARREQPVLLLVAAGPLQIPAFEEARRLGCSLVAVDRSDSAPGMRLADRAYRVDIKESEKIIAIARQEKISGVASICTDFAVRTVADVAEALGLPGISPASAQRATDKRLMRRAFLAAGAPAPLFVEVNDRAAALRAADRIGYPVALKIPGSAGSRGVYRVATPGELRQRYQQARLLEPSADLLVEEWLNGPEISVEGCCVGCETHVIQITDKQLFDGPHPVEAGHTQPSRLSPSVQQEIRRVAVAGITALGFEDCGFHAELKVTESGPRLIEIAARLGGDRISTHLTPLSTGVNLVRATLEIALGRKPRLIPGPARGAAIRYFQVPATGFLQQVQGLEDLACLPNLEYLSTETERGERLRPGLYIGPVQSSLDRCGYVIFSGKNADEAAYKAESAVASVGFCFAEQGFAPAEMSPVRSI